MRIAIVVCLFTLVFSVSALAEQKHKLEDSKENGLYIEASPTAVSYGWPSTAVVTPEIQPQENKILKISTDALSGMLLQFDKIFYEYQNKSKNLKIKEIELGISIDAEGKLYIVNAKTTATIKIILEEK